MNICVVQSSSSRLTETFIRAQIELLPANVTAVYGQPVQVQGRPVLSTSLASRSIRVFRRRASSLSNSEIAYQAVFRRSNADAVLAEYGMTGVNVMRVCRRNRTPLIVHFHGYDASRKDILDRYSDLYRELFLQAAAIVAVSDVMRQQLISLGAPPDKVFYNPYGVDCTKFEQSDPSSSAAVLLSVGRFVEKKAPHLLLLSFARVCGRNKDAELHMIGDGPLLGVCRDLATALGIAGSVRFLGAQPHHVVRGEMLRARAFVQHSAVASDNDTEGTPVSILEAGASGLPVVSTRHAGIPSVVVHDETGFLVEERDVQGMAEYMNRVLTQPQLASALGAAARKRIEKYFRMEQSIGRLWSIIRSGVDGKERPPLDFFSNG